MKNIRLYYLISVLFLLISGINTGSAQVNWTKYQGNPVMTAGPGFSSSGFPFVSVVKWGDTLHQWVTLSDGNPVSNDRIGHATSTDAIHFDLEPFVKLEPSFGSGEFDEEGVFGARVLYDGTQYRMYYNGYNTQPYYQGKMMVGLATSTDLQTWTRYSNEGIFKPGINGSWDDEWAYQSTVLSENGQYKMWYTGFNGTTSKIGYATSADGISWTKYASNPVIDPFQNGCIHAQNPCVIHENGQYEMWFNTQQSASDPYNIQYATSTDGFNWNVNPAPVLIVGSPASFDDLWVWHPCVRFENGVYQMWYSGYNGTSWAVGYATDSTLAGVEPLHESPAGEFMLSFTPNPSPGITRLTIQHASPGNHQLYIINLQGIIMKRLPVSIPDSGVLTMELSSENLPSGMYFCGFEENKIPQKNKLILLK